MKPLALNEADDVLASSNGPYLSYSRINRYLLCPEQYRLYYVEGLRPRVMPAALIFGQLVHSALAAFFTSQTDPVQFFVEAWHMLKTAPLNYGARDSWSRLDSVGTHLLVKFKRDEARKITDIVAVEQPFKLDISTLSVPLVGIIDLQGNLDGRRTVIDFKTAASSLEPHEACLSDQLTTYGLAAPEAKLMALCVLVKTKEPRIEWHVTSRDYLAKEEFLAKTRYVGNAISRDVFYKRPGKWCAWCDFLPVCTGDQEGVRVSLTKVA